MEAPAPNENRRPRRTRGSSGNGETVSAAVPADAPKNYWTSEGERTPTIPDLLNLQLSSLTKFAQLASVLNSIRLFRAILEEQINSVTTKFIDQHGSDELFVHGLGVRIDLGETCQRLAALEQTVLAMQVVETTTVRSLEPTTEGSKAPPTARTGTDG